MTNVAFKGFPCYPFEGGRGFLIADVKIECNTAEHSGVTSLAWIAVIVYPVGLMATNLMLLLKARKAIIHGKHTPLSRSIAFLYEEYDVACFWWEIAEMLRKFLLVGLFVTIEPGSMTQIALATIITAIFLLVQLQAKPYKNLSDDFLACVCSFALQMVFFCRSSAPSPPHTKHPRCSFACSYWHHLSHDPVACSYVPLPIFVCIASSTSILNSQIHRTSSRR